MSWGVNRLHLITNILLVFLTFFITSCASKYVESDSDPVLRVKGSLIQNEKVRHNASVVRTKIMANWTRPEGAEKGMFAKLRILMARDGRVISVELVDSSGYEKFDRNAIEAVHKSSPLEELARIEAQIYEKYFKSFVLLFQPEDL